MKTLLLALVACAPIFAQPACISVTDVIYSVGVSTPAVMNGSLSLSLGYTAADGSFTVTQSDSLRAIKDGVLSVCLAPGNYQARYSVSRAGGTGSVPSTRYWVIPSSGGPFTVAQVETSVAATPALTVALSQLGGGGATNGQCPVWSTAQSQWVPGACGGGGLPSNITTQSVALVPDAPTCVLNSSSGASTFIYAVVGFNSSGRNTVSASCTVTGVDASNFDISITPSAKAGISYYSIYRLQSSGSTTGMIANGKTGGDAFEDPFGFYAGNGLLPPPANDTGLTSSAGLTVTGGVHLPVSWASGLTIDGAPQPMLLNNSASTSTPIYVSFIYDADSGKYLSGQASIGNSLAAQNGAIDTPNLYGFVLDPHNPDDMQTLTSNYTTFVLVGSNSSTLADLTGAYTIFLQYQSALDNFGGKNAVVFGFFGTCADSVCYDATQIESVSAAPYMQGTPANGAADPSITQLWTSPQAYILPEHASAAANIVVGGPGQANSTKLFAARPSQTDTPNTSPMVWAIQQTSNANPFGTRYDQRMILGLNPDHLVTGEPQWTLNWEDAYCFSAGPVCQSEIYITVQSPDGSNLYRPMGWTIPFNNAKPTMELGQDLISLQDAARSFVWGQLNSSTGIILTHAGAAFRGPVAATTFSQPLSTPSSSTATCTASAMVYDAGFIYVCTATNTWKRAALATF